MIALKRYVVGFLFPVDSPGEVVLLHKDTSQKPDVAWQNGLLNGLGGKVEHGEHAAAAMTRERREEAGFSPTWQHVATLTDGAFEMHVYRGECGTHEVPAENDVGETFHVVRVRDVVEQRVRTIPNLQWMVPMCLGADSAFWPFSIIQPVPEDHDDG